MKTTTDNAVKIDVLLGRVGSDLEMHDGLWRTIMQKLSYDEFMKGVAYPTMMTICRDPGFKPSGRNFAMLLLTDAGEYYQKDELVKYASKYIDFAKKLLQVSYEKQIVDLGGVTYDEVRGICDYMFADATLDLGDMQLNGLIEGLKTMKGDAKKIKNQRFFLERVMQRVANAMRESASVNNKNLTIVEEDIQSMVKSINQRIDNMLK